MAYLSPEQITGQVLLNMHVNDRGQLVTSSNLDIKNLEYSGSRIEVLDRGKIYSKYIKNTINSVTLPSLDKLMNNVTEFTFAGWLRLFSSHYSDEGAFYLDILDEYLTLGSSKKGICLSVNRIEQVCTYYNLNNELWSHIAIVLHDGKIAIFLNGSRIIDVAYQEYPKKGTELLQPYDLYVDDICLILNQAVWTDNFTPPEEPLLGGLKYKTALCPKNAIIADPSDLMVKLY